MSIRITMLWKIPNNFEKKIRSNVERKRRTTFSLCHASLGKFVLEFAYNVQTLRRSEVGVPKLQLGNSFIVNIRPYVYRKLKNDFAFEKKRKFNVQNMCEFPTVTAFFGQSLQRSNNQILSTMLLSGALIKT